MVPALLLSRLQAFELKTSSFGIKLTYFHRDNLSFDLSYDRYHMRGLDGLTSQLAYPSANVFTLGFQWQL